MLPYLIIFTLSTALSALACNFRNKNHAASILLLAISMLPLCILAGLRDITIGTDISIYAERDFFDALSTPYLQFLDGPAYGLLYDSCVWLAVNITHSHFAYFFILQALVVVPFTITFWRIDKRYTWVAMLIYSFIFFGYSLNLMKQLIAAAFVVASYCFVRKRKLIPFLIFVLIGMGFHITAALGFLLYPYLLPLREKTIKNLRIKRIFQFAVIFIAALISVTFKAWLPMLASIKDTYQQQFGLMQFGAHSVAEFFAKPSYVLLTIALLLLTFFAIILVMRNYKAVKSKGFTSTFAQDDELISLSLILLLGFVMMLTVLVSPQLYRIGFYYLCLATVLAQLLMRRLSSAHVKYIALGGIIAVNVVAFFVIFIVGHSCEIYPFTSSILPIVLP